MTSVSVGAEAVWMWALWVSSPLDRTDGAMDGVAVTVGKVSEFAA